MILRKATTEDCKRLSEIKKFGMESEYSNPIFNYKKEDYSLIDNENELKILLENKDLHIFLIEDEGVILGYCMCGKTIHNYNNIPFEISGLYVDPISRGKGIGKKLIQEAFKIFKESQYEKGFVSCNEHNLEGLKFYNALKLEVIGKSCGNGDPVGDQVRFGLVK